MVLLPFEVSCGFEMTAWDKEVEEKLGNSAWSLLIEYVNSGKISAQQAKDFARLLGENLPNSVIFSAHVNRLNEKNHRWDNAELRCILEQWFCEELFKLDRKDALIKLAKIFDDHIVKLHPLASDLRKLIDSEEETETVNGTKR